MISWASPWAFCLLIPVGLLVIRRRWVGVLFCSSVWQGRPPRPSCSASARP